MKNCECGGKNVVVLPPKNCFIFTSEILCSFGYPDQTQKFFISFERNVSSDRE